MGTVRSNDKKEMNLPYSFLHSFLDFQGIVKSTKVLNFSYFRLVLRKIRSNWNGLVSIAKLLEQGTKKHFSNFMEFYGNPLQKKMK